MILHKDARRYSLLDITPRASSAILMLAGGLVTAGWIFDIAPLKSNSPHWVMMKLNTAACFILTGASLWCLSDEQARKPIYFAGRILAAVVAFVALLTLGEHALSVDFGIDQVLMKQPPTAADPASPGRMSAATSFSFLLVALALLGLDSKNRHGHRPALALALLSGVVGLLALAGYIYGVKTLYAFSPFSSMAVHTALLLIAACVGILCARPDEGPLGILTASGVGSAMARRVLPLAIVLPILIGWLRLQGERAGFYGFEFGLALIATANVVVFTMLIWLTAVSLNRADTARRRTEDTLRDSERRFRALLEHSADSISMIDQNNRILHLSPAVAAVEGYAAEELIGRNGIENTHPDDLPLVQEIVRKLMENPGTPVPVLWRRRHKNGEWLWLEGVATNLLHDPAVRAIVTNYRDVTGRKRAEEALLRFRMAMESSRDGIFLVDFETFRYLDVNETGCRMLGYSREELLTMRTIDTNPDITEADQRRRFEEAKALGTDHVMTESRGRSMRRRDGSTFPIEVARRYLRIGDSEIVVGIARDVTERQRAEEDIRRLNAELEQRVADRTAELHAKNKELETFSYSVSHDLKAPLRGIDGYSRLLLTDYANKLDDDGRGFLTNIRTATAQMQQLIDDLLAYSKLEQRSVQTARIDMPMLVETILKERAHDLKLVQLTVQVSCAPVRADREGLSIVMRNLIDNAVKFSRRRDPPVLDIRSRVEGGRHILSVRDNGTGFDMKYHDRIFQIFQRLHRAEDYSGTGVGLAIVHKAMERMGGRVWAESEPGRGAIFHLDLPLEDAAQPSDCADRFMQRT